MFGYQRVGDLIWAFGDLRGRGFMLGGTAGRTTLNGEGLQHEDGHSPLLFSAIPNVRIYDPAFAFELATVIRDGMRRMYVDGEDIFYYITLYNENYPMPPMPEGSEDGILRGLYLYRRAGRRARAPSADCRQRQRRAGRDRGAGDAARTARRRRRGVERHELPAAAPGRARGRALEPVASRCRAARIVRRRAAGRRRRTDRRGDRLHEGGPRSDRALRHVPRSSRSAPTAMAAATRASRCAGTSRSTPGRSRSPCSTGSRGRSVSPVMSSPRPSSTTRLDTELADPRYR